MTRHFACTHAPADVTREKLSKSGITHPLEIVQGVQDYYRTQPNALDSIHVIGETNQRLLCD